jgi:hypothetical protein
MTYLETGRAPVDKLDGSLRLDVGDSSVDILGDDVSSVEKTTGHVLALPGVALDHLVVALETRDCHLGYRVGLVERCTSAETMIDSLTLFGRDDGCVGSKREMDPRERNQVGLELVQIDVEGTVESKRCGNGGNDLGDETVEVGE